MRNIFRTVLGSLIIVSMFVNTGCVEELINDGDGKENTSNGDSNSGGLSEQDFSFEWISDVQEDAPIVLVSGGQITLEFKTDNVESVTVKDAPLGWETNIDAEKSTLSIKASSEGKTSVVNLTLIAKSTEGTEKIITVPFSYVYVDSFDDPRGTFVLNEGNMTTENGSLIYITPEGEIIDDVYKQINGTELGNVCQDMAFCDGKIYIISQNGEINETGIEFMNDGMLVIIDAKTLKKIDSYTKEELSMLSWPSHISVLDDNHVYIRDNGVKEGDNGSGKIWRINTTDRSVTEIKGTTGVPKSPLYKRGDKLYTYVYEEKELFGIKFCYFKIIEIQSSSDEAKEYKTSTSDFIPVNILPANEDNVFWVLLKHESEEYYSIGKTKLRINDLDKVYSASIEETPNDGASGVRFVSTDDNTFYYTSSTFVIKGSYREESGTGTSDGKKIIIETEVLTDLMELDSNAREVYNGLGIHPVTGHLYVNTIKGMGNMYTTNQIWEFDLGGNLTDPVNKWSNNTNFPAGFFFPGVNK